MSYSRVSVSLIFKRQQVSSQRAWMSRLSLSKSLANSHLTEDFRKTCNSKTATILVPLKNKRMMAQLWLRVVMLKIQFLNSERKRILKCLIEAILKILKAPTLNNRLKNIRISQDKIIQEKVDFSSNHPRPRKLLIQLEASLNQQETQEIPQLETLLNKHLQRKLTKIKPLITLLKERILRHSNQCNNSSLLTYLADCL